MDKRKASTQKNYSLITNIYTNDFSNSFEHFDFLDQMILEIKKLPHKQNIIVDLGSGPGTVIDYLKNEHDFHYQAVDITPEFYHVLHRKYKKEKNIEVVCQDMVSYVQNTPSSTVSAFTANFSIIHIPDEEIDALFQDINRALKNGGFLFISCYEGDYKGMLQDPYQLNEDPRVTKTIKLESYINFFTEKELVKRLKQSGFEIIRVEKHDMEELSASYKGKYIYLLARKIHND